MKQHNFLFVDIISSIFLLVMLIGNFMGLVYITEGNLVISILASMFLIVCYYFVVQLLKKNKELMIRNNFIHYSLIFGAFFIMLGFISFYLMSHSINIEYNCKEQIKKEATTKIKLVDSLVAIYKRKSSEDMLNFEAELKTKLTAYKSTGSINTKNDLIKDPYKVDATILANSAYIDVRQVAGAKVTPCLLKIQKNTKNMDSTIILNSKKYQSVFDNWKRLSIMSTYTKLNQYVDENLVLINTKIAELPLDKTPILISFDKTQIPLNSPSKLNKIHPPKIAFPFIIILMIHLFILIPFFTEKIRTYTTFTNTEDPKKKQKTTIEI